jgi:hypothetical protein
MSDRLQRAARHIDATDLGGEWAYYADETGRYYLIDEDDLVSLCDYLDDEDPQVSGDAYSHWCAGTHSREMPAGWVPGDATERTFTIYDADPDASGPSAWPDSEDIEAQGDSIQEAVEYVRGELASEAAGLEPSHGYEIGQRIYALVFDLDGTPTKISHELTAEDLGVDSEVAS